MAQQNYNKETPIGQGCIKQANGLYYSIYAILYFILDTDSFKISKLNKCCVICYQVTAVPTVLGVRDGKVVDRLVGLANPEQLDDLLAKISNGD